MSQPRIREARTTKLHGKGHGYKEEAISASDHIRHQKKKNQKIERIGRYHKINNSHRFPKSKGQKFLD